MAENRTPSTHLATHRRPGLSQLRKDDVLKKPAGALKRPAASSGTGVGTGSHPQQLQKMKLSSIVSLPVTVDFICTGLLGFSGGTRARSLDRPYPLPDSVAGLGSLSIPYKVHNILIQVLSHCHRQRWPCLHARDAVLC